MCSVLIYFCTICKSETFSLFFFLQKAPKLYILQTPQNSDQPWFMRQLGYWFLIVAEVDLKDTREEILVRKLSYCLVFAVARGLFLSVGSHGCCFCKHGPGRGRRSWIRAGGGEVEGRVCHSQGGEQVRMFSLDWEDAFARSVSNSILK